MVTEVITNIKEFPEKSSFQLSHLFLRHLFNTENFELRKSRHQKIIF